MARSSSSLLSSKDCILVFVCVILLSFNNNVPSTCSSWGASASVLEESESWRSMSIEAYLQAVDVPGVKTFQLSDGDVITCVNITDQVSSPRDPQLAPSVQPKEGNSTDPGATSLKPSVQTIISDLNEGCQPGTIPTRRNGLQLTSRVQTAGSVRNYFRKHRDGTPGVPEPDPPARFHDHEHAVAFLGPTDEPIKGVEVFINVWSPFVNRQAKEFSLAQLWLIGWGSVNSSKLSTMEVGWQVFRDFYGDFRPRLFIYWTADAYNTTGCYNLDCPGFVQVSNKVLLGGSFNLSSITDSTQYEIKLRIFKDPESGNWWLQLNNENVGYWPGSLFEILKDYATAVQWGGEIINASNATHTNATHTVTDMGSGQFASAGYQRAAFQRNLQYVDSQLQLRDAWAATTIDEVPGCYNSRLGYSPYYWGSYMYFGGPGYNNVSCV